MHEKLREFTEKKGIDVAELTEEEKATFDKWDSILSEKAVTVESIAGFCEIQINAIESLWDNLENSTQKNERLILQHIMYRKFLKMIFATRVERESLITDLTNSLDSESKPDL